MCEKSCSSECYLNTESCVILLITYNQDLECEQYVFDIKFTKINSLNSNYYIPIMMKIKKHRGSLEQIPSTYLLSKEEAGLNINALRNLQHLSFSTLNWHHDFSFGSIFG